jgi:hypothetical protein
MAENRVTVAVVQAGSILFDRERTLQKAADLTLDAARRGARLVVFPEAFVGGYPKGLDFGARVGSRTPEGREQFRVYYEAPWKSRALAAMRSAAWRATMRWTWSSAWWSARAERFTVPSCSSRRMGTCAASIAS